MKTFFGRFLASLTALVVFFTIAGFLLILSLFAIPLIFSSKSTIKLDSKAYILNLHSDDFWGERTEQNTASRLKNVLGKSQNWGLGDFIHAIKLAKTDSNIRHIYLELSFNPNSYATIYTMRQALIDFKQSGKKIYAFARTLDQKSYLLSTVADSIFLSGDAQFLWDGMGKNAVFFKGFLDKIGLDMQIFYAGKFKSATEPFRRTSMSEESRLQQREILDFFYDSMLAQISRSRNISIAKLNRYADNLSLTNSAKARDLHFVDGIKSWEEVDISLRQGLPKETEHLDIKKYLSYNEQEEAKQSRPSKSQIAIVYADGDIVPNGTGAIQDQAIEGVKFAKCIRKLAEDDLVKALVLRVNSPGGSVSASEEIYDALQYFRKFKPVVVSFGSVAASGGYYIACASDYIIADPYCITGSIGVFAMVPNVEGMLQDKLSLNFDGIKTNENTFTGSNFSPKQRAFFQSQVEDTYRRFKDKVARARDLSMEEVENIAQGRVWIAPQALKIGLIDQIGSLEQAINKAASLAKLTEGNYQLKSYPEAESLFEKWFSDSHYGIKILQKLWHIWQYQENPQASDISSLIAASYAQWSKISPKATLVMRMPYAIQP